MAGLSQQELLSQTPPEGERYSLEEKEVPRGTETNVVVAVVVPVVDIDTAIVAVTDVHTVAVRGKLLAPICVTEDLGLLPSWVYILFLLNLIWEQSFDKLWTPPQKQARSSISILFARYWKP